MDKIFATAASAITVGAATLFIIGIVSDFGFAFAIDDNLFGLMRVNDHIQQAISFSSIALVVGLVFISVILTRLLSWYYAKRTWLRYYRYAVRVASKHTSRKEIWRVSPDKLVLGFFCKYPRTANIITVIFLAILSYFGGRYLASGDAYGRARAALFAVPIFSAVLVAVAAVSWIPVVVSSRLARASVMPDPVSEVVVENISIALAAIALIALVSLEAGIAQANMALNRNGVLLERDGKLLQVVALRYLENGIVVYNHCYDQVIILPHKDDWKIMPMPNRDIYCGSDLPLNPALEP